MKKRELVGAFGLLAWAAASAAGQAEEKAAFVVRLGRDTFAVENITRVPGRLESELTGAAIGRVVLRVEEGPEATIPLLTLRVWRPGASPDSAPAQSGRLEFRDDTAVVSFSIPAGTPTQRIATRPGALPFLNPSFGLIEEMMRHARALGGDTVTFPFFSLQGGRTTSATVVWATDDSASLNLGGVRLDLVISPDGRLLSGTVPAQNLTVTRVEGTHPSPVALAAPDYSAPAGAPYTADDVRVATPGGFDLVGTLTRPAGAGPVPAVVMVTGSGSEDRDEAIPIVRGYRPFRDIADTLSRRGIAVLRLDDRGYGASGGDASRATSADFADDVRAALAWLRQRPDIDPRRLAVIGHSEGGLIAPMVAATDTALAAIVLLAGPAETGREIIAYQQRYAIEQNPSIPPASRDSVVAAAREQLQAVAAGQPWLAYFLDYDPLPTARKVTRTPVLILQGGTDRQVTPGQADTLAAAFRAGGNRDVTERVFPGLNHLMLPDSSGNPAGYATLESRHVDPALLGVLADWLVDRLR